MDIVSLITLKNDLAVQKGYNDIAYFCPVCNTKPKGISYINEQSKPESIAVKSGSTVKLAKEPTRFNLIHIVCTYCKTILSTFNYSILLLMLILQLLTGFKVMAQSQYVFGAYEKTTEYWNSHSNKFEQRRKAERCNYAVFILQDKIKIKDERNTVYYIANKNGGMTSENEAIAATIFPCYDSYGDDCLVTLAIDRQTSLVYLIVGYDKKRQYTYSLKEK